MWQQFVLMMPAHWWKSLEQMMWLIINLEIWKSSLRHYPCECLCCLDLLPFDCLTPSELLKFFPVSKALFCKAESPFWMQFVSMLSTDFIVKLNPLIGRQAHFHVLLFNDCDMNSFVASIQAFWRIYNGWINWNKSLKSWVKLVNIKLIL